MQILGAMQSGARFSHHQMPIRLHENPVQRLDEKREPVVCHVCVLKSLYAGNGRAKPPRELIREQCAQFRKSGDKSGNAGTEIRY